MSNVTGPGTAQDRNRLFEQLVDRYQEPVLRMCYYCLCDKTQAEDAAQETFLKLYRTLDNYRGDCSEKTWIMKIATRVCYDMNHSGWFRFMNRHGNAARGGSAGKKERRGTGGGGDEAAL